MNQNLHDWNEWSEKWLSKPEMNQTCTPKNYFLFLLCENTFFTFFFLQGEGGRDGQAGPKGARVTQCDDIHNFLL